MHSSGQGKREISIQELLRGKKSKRPLACTLFEFHPMSSLPSSSKHFENGFPLLPPSPHFPLIIAPPPPPRSSSSTSSTSSLFLPSHLLFLFPLWAAASLLLLLPLAGLGFPQNGSQRLFSTLRGSISGGIHGHRFKEAPLKIYTF